MTGPWRRIEQCVRECGLVGETGQARLPVGGHKPVFRAKTTQGVYTVSSVFLKGPDDRANPLRRAFICASVVCERVCAASSGTRASVARPWRDRFRFMSCQSPRAAPFCQALRDDWK
jgi:hypothetical protein